MLVGETKPGSGSLWSFNQPGFITEGEAADPADWQFILHVNSTCTWKQNGFRSPQPTNMRGHEIIPNYKIIKATPDISNEAQSQIW